MESVGPSDDKTDFGVEAFHASVGDAVFDRVEDDVSALTNRFRCFDERSKPGSLGSGTPRVEEHTGLIAGEAASEDRPELFFHFIGPPDPTPGSFHPRELRGLFVGEVLRGFQQGPPGASEIFRVSGIG